MRGDHGAFNAFIGPLAHPTTSPWHEDAGIMLFRHSAAAFSPFAVTLSVLLSLWPSTCLVRCRLRHKVLSNPCVLPVVSTSILSRSRRQHLSRLFRLLLLALLSIHVYSIATTDSIQDAVCTVFLIPELQQRLTCRAQDEAHSGHLSHQ
jgi:hypothetical protein